MSDGVEIHATPDLDEPVLIVALEGWIDAGNGAASAVQSIAKQLDPAALATFDADVFLDYRARRPTLHIRDGVNSALTWPGITMSYGQDSTGRDVLLLTGFEPDMAWVKFSTLVRAIAVDHGTTMMVGLGAYPIGVPHTRPTLVSCTASTPELALASGLLRNSVDVPAGVQAALERGFADLGLPAIGLWAQVPHYATAMPFPAAAAALLDTVHSVAGIRFDTSELHGAASAHRQRLDELVGQSDEHRSMVHQLEVGYDSALAATETLGSPGSPLPSGDELAAELERYLRDQGS